MRHRGRVAAAGPPLAALITLAALGAPGSLGAEDAALVFEFERYNDDYSGLETVATPIERGPLTIRLTSPRYDLAVHANRLELEPAGECRHRARLWGRFSGDGDLIADVELGSFPARFEDRVGIPEQEREIEGLVAIEPVDRGYRVTLVELPRTVSVEIESELASGLVSFCRRLSLFVVGDAGCGALDHVLSNPPLTLPEPGTRFLVRRDQFTDSELRRLNAYLGRHAGCALAASSQPGG